MATLAIINKTVGHNTMQQRYPGEETLAARVKRLREGRGLSQDGLARLAGVSKTHVYQLEHGLRMHLQTQTLLKYADALGVSARYLESGYEPAPQPDQEWPSIDVCLQATSSLDDDEIKQIVEIIRMLERKGAGSTE